MNLKCLAGPRRVADPELVGSETKVCFGWPFRLGLSREDAQELRASGVHHISVIRRGRDQEG